MLKFDVEVLGWSLMLKFEVKVWSLKSKFKSKFEVEVWVELWIWSLNLKFDVEVLSWSLNFEV